MRCRARAVSYENPPGRDVHNGRAIQMAQIKYTRGIRAVSRQHPADLSLKSEPRRPPDRERPAGGASGGSESAGGENYAS